MQRIIVFLMIALSIAYLTVSLIKSLKAKKKGHCAGCGKE